MSRRPLIGPNPEVDVPVLPTPWTTKGALVYDANGVHVLTVPPNERFPADRLDVAAAVADTMNRAHDRQNDGAIVLHYNVDRGVYVDSHGRVWWPSRNATALDVDEDNPDYSAALSDRMLHKAVMASDGTEGQREQIRAGVAAVLRELAQRPEPWDRHELADIYDEIEKDDR